MEEADGSLLLWLGEPRYLEILRFGPDRPAPPEQFSFERAELGWMLFAGGDMNGDGQEDIVLGATVPWLQPTVIFGPLGPRIDASDNGSRDCRPRPTRLRPMSGRRRVCCRRYTKRRRIVRNDCRCAGLRQPSGRSSPVLSMRESRNERQLRAGSSGAASSLAEFVVGLLSPSAGPRCCSRRLP